MDAIAIFIKRPVFTLMLVLLLVVFGLQAFPTLGVDLNPDVDLPVVSISATMPGASPEEMENLVTKPLEDAVSSLAGIKNLSSTTREGVSRTTIEFEYGTDSKSAANEVREKVAGVRKKLPDHIDEPVVQRVDLGAQAIAIYSLSSAERSAGELRKLAEDVVKGELQRIDGVADVGIYGAAEREISVQADGNKLAQYQISMPQILNAVNNQNINAPGGSVTDAGLRVAVRTIGKYKSVEDIENVIVANQNGRLIRLGDVAAVSDGWGEETVAANINGASGVLVAIQKQSGANTVAVADKAKEALDRLGAALPGDVRVEIAKDGAAFVKESVQDVLTALIFGGILAVAITYLFLQDVRATFIGAAAIPTSIVATFFLMKSMGFTLNTMSLMALSLAVGIVIDDAIVVVENIHRHLETGKNPFRAARDATAQLGLALVATTLTLLAVFVPVGSMGGIVGQFFKQFGLTVSFAVIFSTFVAFTLTPMLSAYLLKPNGSATKTPGKWRRALNAFLNRFEKAFLSLREGYGQTIAWALERPKKIAALALLTLLVNPLLMPFLGKEFQPSYDSGEFSLTAVAPPGTSLEKMKELLRPVEDAVNALPEKKISYAIIGKDGTNKATLGVKLTPGNSRGRNMDEIMDELRLQLKDLGTMKIVVQSDQGMGGDSRPVQIALRGADLGVLTGYARELMDGLQQVKGAADVDMSIDESAPEIQVVLDSAKMSDAGLDAALVGATVQMAFIGETTRNPYNAGGNDYDIRVQLRAENRLNMEDVSNLLISADSGAFVRLGDIAAVKISSGPTQIDRENRQREITVYANAVGSSPGEIMAEAEKLADGLNMPVGYSYGYAGDAEAMQETFGEMFAALLMGAILIYMVLAAQFESFVHPLTIMFSLPFAVSGAITGLLAAGQTMNMMSMIGFIMLMGLVTKNAILLVDHANQMRAAGMDIKAALVDAGVVRLRPILMTTASMVFGVLPIALGIGAGAELRQSMGVVLIGGLITSTVLTLVVVPIIYLLFDKLQQKIQFKKIRE